MSESRRDFIRGIGVSLALAGAGACTRQPKETIVPFARSPEETIPGQPLYFATALSLGGYANGVLVESHGGRPTKVEGNPLHPASLGATDVFSQAAIWTLYDPSRAQFATRNGQLSRWSAFLGELGEAIENQRTKRGAGLRLLTQTVTSPTLGQQIESLLDAFPAARWRQYEAANRDAVREGARLAFGSYINTVYRFDRARVVLSLDADFLCQGPGSVRYARDFMNRRREGNRLYVVETVPSGTGSVADHRRPLRPGEIEEFTRSLAAAVLGESAGDAWIETVARDLKRGPSLVVPGEQQPARVHHLAHVINERLGNLSKTVTLTDPVEALPINQAASIRDLAGDMEAGRVELLVILGGDPAIDAPADAEFASHLANVPFKAHLSLYRNDTSELCDWHIPEVHELEAWSDTRAFDGTTSIVQPLIAPLYDGKSSHQLVAALAGRPDASAYNLVRDYWKGRSYYLSYRTGDRVPSEEDFEELWEQSLHDGLIRGAEADEVSLAVAGGVDDHGEAASRDGLDLVFRPDPTVWDGRFAHNGWLQELPKPITKLTWDNAAQLSPATAASLGVENGDVVELRLGERRMEAPVLLSPGHVDGALSLTLGYGGCAIRTTDGFWHATGLEVRKTGRRHRLATTQQHHRMEGRELVRVHPVGEATVSEVSGSAEYAWGMAIDLDACTGCNACVVACSAENNVPVVGKEEILRGREMHWIRIDHYHEGAAIYHQPVMCLHCENAPCEDVCPVGATVHSAEGLNEMVYNRCVGSRYCANNCPYKVRRFNFFQYADFDTPVRKMQNNPDVTVRTRGVIEKCTYCVQRINAARIDAAREGRPMRQGDIVTACQGACPTEAIVFGNLNDPDSLVARLRADERSYSLLSELNTRPRTTYLARRHNPNPELDRGPADG